LQEKNVKEEIFMLQSEGLRLRVYMAIPQVGSKPFPSVQIHHAGGGYEAIYEHMARLLAERGIVGVAMIHRGYPGSDGEMEYGKGEIIDIGNLTEAMRARPFVDPDRMGIMGYSRGGHNAILSIERFNYFKAGALWSTPVDMLELVRVVPWIAEIIGGFPDQIPEEYHIRSSINFVDQVSCPLLLIHGENDEIVSVNHARRLAEALEAHAKPFEIKIFPGEWHTWSMSGFGNNWKITMDFFERHLKQPSSKERIVDLPFFIFV
jgi:dipeptidyl aminopeptidase/acylaminoacyl peptidase